MDSICANNRETYCSYRKTGCTCLRASDLQLTTVASDTCPAIPGLRAANKTAHLAELKKKKNPKHINTVILLGSCSIKQRSSLCRGEAEHTSLSVSTYKRLSFILLKCCLINVLVTLNISTAGGTFVIVEMAGRVGHRWELLPHTGVDI